MRKLGLMHSSAHADLLANALVETIADLRLVDAGDMIGYITTGQWANIADLVASSSELFLREGVLTFECMADFALGWGTTPSISLDLEFQAQGVSVFFTLILGHNASVIDIKSIWFTKQPIDEDDGTRILADAINAVRLRADATRTSV